MKIAIVHDWITATGGAEQCLKIFAEIYTTADIFVLVSDEKSICKLGIDPKRVKNSVLQKLPFAKTKWRNYLAFFPYAIEQIDVSDYDLVLSSSHAVAKGILTHPSQTHICYIHSPIRYAWDLYHQYLKEANLQKGFKAFIAKLILHYIRIWDIGTTARVDIFIANSQYIAKRVQKIYQKKPYKIIYPPVDVKKFELKTQKEDFYLTASRMVPYKKINLIAEAFAQSPQRQLYIIGDGPDFKKIKKIYAPNIHFLGYQKFEVLKDYMQRAKAFIFAAQEDFGIISVEAQACGTPVIAFGKGGSLETVRGKFTYQKLEATDTGIYFEEQSVDSLNKAIDFFEKQGGILNPETIRTHALQFDKEIFKANIINTVQEILDKKEEINN